MYVVHGPVRFADAPPAWRILLLYMRQPPPDALLFAASAGDTFVAVGALDPAAGRLGPTRVLEGHRGRGLQRLLIDYRKQESAKLGLRQLVTNVDPDNIPSLRSLLRCGFEPVEYDYADKSIVLTWRPT